MSTQARSNAVCVLTERDLGKIVNEGGSQAWVLDAKRARRCAFVICVQNRHTPGDISHPAAPHHTAFMVGRLKDVVPSPGNTQRWRLVFSDFAKINIPDAWPGYRNPVYYTDLESLGIKAEDLDFEPMPESSSAPGGEAATAPVETPPLTIAEAKERLARTFGVPPSCIEITIRA